MIVVSNAYKERLSIGVAHSVKRRERRAYPDGIHMENSLSLANLAIHQVSPENPSKKSSTTLDSSNPPILPNASSQFGVLPSSP
jgi:hypothetical protein